MEGGTEATVTRTSITATLFHVRHYVDFMLSRPWIYRTDKPHAHLTRFNQGFCIRRNLEYRERQNLKINPCSTLSRSEDS